MTLRPAPAVKAGKAAPQRPNNPASDRDPRTTLFVQALVTASMPESLNALAMFALRLLAQRVTGK